MLLCVLTTNGIAATPAGEEQQTATQEIKVSPGDRLKQVAAIYGMPDRKKESKLRVGGKDADMELWWYDSLGLEMRFVGGWLTWIWVKQNFKGVIEGVHVGDKEAYVLKKLGPPDNEDKTGQWLYYKGHGSREKKICIRFDEEKKVRGVIVSTELVKKRQLRKKDPS